MESGILRAGRVLGAESRRSEEAGPGPQCGGLNSTDQVPWGGFGFGEAGSLVGGEFQLRVRHSHLPDPHSISLSLTHTHKLHGRLVPCRGLSLPAQADPSIQVAEARATEEDAQGGSASICSPGVSPSSAQSRPPRATESRLTEQPHHTILMPVPGPLRTGDPRSRSRLPSVGASSRSITSLSGVPQARSGGSDGKETACSAGDPGSIPGSGRSPGEGNGYPLQYSCLENPMDRGAWGATVHGVTKNRTRLK